MAETIVYDGVLEDENGAVMHPATSAKQVICEDGTTAEAKMAAMLPKTGGTMTGDLSTQRGKINVDTWGTLSAGSDGAFVIAQNAFKHPTANTFHFANDHENMGARGLVFRLGIQDVYYFDTGSMRTVKGAAFTPNLVRLATGADSFQKAKLTGDGGFTIDISNSSLNDLTKNGFYAGENLANAPYTGVGTWYYVLVIGMGTGYTRQICFDAFGTTFYTRALVANVWSGWNQIITDVGGVVKGAFRIESEGGDGLALVGASHIYIPIYKTGLAGGRSGYFGYGDGATSDFTIANELGGAIKLQSAGGLHINGRRVPVTYQSTAAPTAADGADGDVWHQYV